VDALIDSLVGALPLIFVALWVIRLIARRSKAAPEQAVAKTAASDSPDLSEVQDIQEPVQVPSSSPAPESPSPGKGIKPVVRNRPVKVEEQGRRIVEETPVRKDWHSRSDSSAPDSPDPFENLSPPARGMVWSVILDKPPSLKDPEY
jgi:hypothetical protein